MEEEEEEEEKEYSKLIVHTHISHISGWRFGAVIYGMCGCEEEGHTVHVGATGKAWCWLLISMFVVVQHE